MLPRLALLILAASCLAWRWLRGYRDETMGLWLRAHGSHLTGGWDNPDPRCPLCRNRLRRERRDGARFSKPTGNSSRRAT